MHQPRLRRSALLPVLLLAAVTACSTDGGASSAGPAKPRSGGSLTYAAQQEPDCWDPHTSAQDVTAFVQRPVFDSLVHQTPDGELEPWLAKSWKTSEGGRTYTFELRDDVTFHDGKRLDAAAVKANFDHITAKATRSQYAAGLLGPYEGTTVKGKYEAEVRFSRPYAPFLQAASTTYLGMASPASLKAGADTLCAGTGSVGSGPFEAGAYTRGQQRGYTRNAAYAWAPKGAGHSGPARLDAFTIRFLTEDATRVGALTSGQVDAAAALPANRIAAVRRDARLDVVTKDVPGAVDTFYLNTKSPLFSDERVRKAFQRSIDLDALVKSVFQGTGTRAWSTLSPATPHSYDPALVNSWPYDRALAGRLLDRAGWTGRDAEGYRTKNGERLTVTAPVYGQASVFSQAVQGDLKKAGIDLRLAASTDATAVSAQLDEGRYDVVETSWARGDGDILSSFFLSTESSEGGGHNFARVTDPQVDAWLKKAQAATSPDERAAYYGKVQKWTTDHAAVVPAYVQKAAVGVNKKVHGLRLSLSAWPEFYAAWVEAGR
ncbi:MULTISPECIES: ABC transporter substrate-binding protein [unclassified Streptomyces]|uniref:ABC transporter substrate-binding protein n=1 Tax=unclassified Streptomyces TaxID=2593676 RepID=UPI002E815852|nr:ABC transporter substrate-binding protein [Streptomyces sp. NBC_00523]WUC98841.1 ABC transporter substrate-binding protein [Streptomyces sp. NBC_00523]